MIETATKKVRKETEVKHIPVETEEPKKIYLENYPSYETVKKLMQQHKGVVFILPNGKEAKYED